MILFPMFSVKKILILFSVVLLLAFVDIDKSFASENELYSIDGVLVNGTDNAQLASHLVILHVSVNEEIFEYSSTSDINGIFQFDNINHPSNSIIGVSSIYEGVLYGIDLGIISELKDEIILTVYKSSSDSSDISISTSTIMFTSVDRSQNTVWVLELAKINNNSNTTYKPDPEKPMSILRFGLPENFVDLMIDSDLIGVEFVTINKGFGILGNIYPGEHQLLFTYGINYFDSSLEFMRKTQFELNNLRIISENSIDLDLNDFDYLPEVTNVNDIQYNLIEINDIPKNKTISINLKNLPKPSLFDRTGNFIKDLNTGWLLLSIFMIISFSMLAKIYYSK